MKSRNMFVKPRFFSVNVLSNRGGLGLNRSLEMMVSRLGYAAARVAR